MVIFRIQLLLQAFCQVEKSTQPEKLDFQEAARVAQAVKDLDLQYVVITSVARDDLTDHGASLFTRTISAIRKVNPTIAIEVLTPDFKGYKPALEKVFNAQPEIFSHNIESVERI